MHNLLVSIFVCDRNGKIFAQINLDLQTPVLSCTHAENIESKSSSWKLNFLKKRSTQVVSENCSRGWRCSVEKKSERIGQLDALSDDHEWQWKTRHEG